MCLIKKIVTGNTVIHTLLQLVKIIEHDQALKDSMQQRFDFIDPAKKIILVTDHKRESSSEYVKPLKY
jgi:UDP-N-acetylglucosamine 2-epimerase (non-hydrolysing)